MTREMNLATQQRLGEIINAGDVDRLAEVFAPDVVDHDPAPNQGPGIEGFKTFFKTLSSAFPDAQLHVERTVADEDQVAIAYRLTGTHKGDFLGIKTTGKDVDVRGVQVARFRNGKIVERWGSTDELGILQQIGADEVPTPPGEGGLSAKKVVAGVVVAAAGVAAAGAVKGKSGDDETPSESEPLAGVDTTPAPPTPAPPTPAPPTPASPAPSAPIAAPLHKDSMPTNGPDDGARL